MTTGDAAQRPPSVQQLAEFIIHALIDLGGSASTGEIHRALASSKWLTPEQLQARHGPRGRSEVEYRTRWALVDLRHRGRIERIQPGRWHLTESASATANDESGVRR